MAGDPARPAAVECCLGPFGPFPENSWVSGRPAAAAIMKGDSSRSEGCKPQQEILHDLLPSNVVRKMRDNPDAKSECETRLVVVLVKLNPAIHL